MGKEGLDHKRAEFIARAQTAFDRMFGEDGENGLVTFSQREERACEVTDELARWLMAEHVWQNVPGDGRVECRCPICHGALEPQAPGQAAVEIRELMTRRGKISYPRTAGRCPQCRRIFFPAG